MQRDYFDMGQQRKIIVNESKAGVIVQHTDWSNRTPWRPQTNRKVLVENKNPPPGEDHQVWPGTDTGP